MQPIYNIPLDQYQPNLQNHYEFPQAIQIDTQPPATMQMEDSINAIYLDTPPLQPYQQVVVSDITLESVAGVVYRAPTQLSESISYFLSYSKLFYFYIFDIRIENFIFCQISISNRNF